jgi:CRP-like cAMP-binding protein
MSNDAPASTYFYTLIAAQPGCNRIAGAAGDHPPMSDLEIALRRSAPSGDGCFEERDVRPGDVLIREGAHAQDAYFVLDGEADVSIDGRVVGEVQRGEFVGEMALLSHAPRSATVTARTPMRLLVVGAAEFGGLFARPALARHIAETLTERLRRLQGAAHY